MAEKKEKVQFSGTEESALGNSLVAKWLGLCALTARVWGAWWAADYGVAQSQTRLNRLSSSSSSKRYLYFFLVGFY